MLDSATLERDLRFLQELPQSNLFQALHRDLPVLLQPGVTIVDLDRFVAALAADCAAALAGCQSGIRSLVMEATAHAAHHLVDGLRDLLERHDSETAGWEALAEARIGSA